MSIFNRRLKQNLMFQTISSRSEPLFAPNVALAPLEFQKKSQDDTSSSNKYPVPISRNLNNCSPWINSEEEEFEVNVSSDTEDEGDHLQSSSSATSGEYKILQNSSLNQRSFGVHIGYTTD